MKNAFANDCALTTPVDMSNMIGKLILCLFVAITACASEKVVFAKVTSEDMKTATVLECPSDVYDKMFRWDPVTGADYSIKKLVTNAKSQLKIPSGYECEFLSLMLTAAISDNETEVWYYNVAFRFIPDLKRSPGIKDGTIIKIVPMLADGSFLSERVANNER